MFAREFDGRDVHRRILSVTPLCVYVDLLKPEDVGPDPQVTDDLEAVTCRECLRMNVD